MEVRLSLATSPSSGNGESTKAGGNWHHPAASLPSPDGTNGPQRCLPEGSRFKREASAFAAQEGRNIKILTFFDGGFGAVKAPSAGGRLEAFIKGLLAGGHLPRGRLLGRSERTGASRVAIGLFRLRKCAQRRAVMFGRPATLAEY